MPARRRRSSRSTALGGTLAIGLILFVAVCVFLYDELIASGRVDVDLPRLEQTLPALRTAYPRQTLPPLDGGTSGDWYTVYFTNIHLDGSGGPDEALAAAIDGAQESVDIAAYTLNLPVMEIALRNAHQRGVRVRVVMDSENMDGPVPEKLRDIGVPFLGDRREGLMHNKFIVIDGQEVWTGSMNFTTTGTYNDHNNLIRIRSSRIAADYAREFEEMFTEDEFGPGSPADTPYPSVTVNGTRVEVYFSPDDGISDRLVEVLSGADHSIYFLAYSFTSDPLAEAILERSEAGVTIGGIFEEQQYGSNQGTEFDRFVEAGLDVRLDGIDGLMHHKVFIIDEQIVVTGSYNFSASAENRNDENVVIIHDPTVAQLYLAEYQSIYNEAQ